MWKQNSHSILHEEVCRLHALQKFMLSMVDRICRRDNLEYVLLYQTLMGAVLNRDFLPGSLQQSIALRRPDFDRLLPQLKKLSDERFYLEKFTDKDGSPALHARLCCHESKLILRETPLLEKHEQVVALTIYPLDNGSAEKRQAGKIKRILASLIVLSERREKRRLSYAELQRHFAAPYLPGQLSLFFGRLLPQAILRRRAEHLAASRKKKSAPGDNLLIYAPLGGLVPCTFFPKNILFPPAFVSIGDKLCMSPARAHETLVYLYGDYRKADGAMQAEEALEELDINTVFWADIIYAAHPEMMG